MDESDPDIIAATGTVTPSPTIFVGTPGSGRSGSIGGSGASATDTVTGAASGLLAEEMFGGYAGLAWGIIYDPGDGSVDGRVEFNNIQP
jgi:hypothetical protein